MSTIGVLGATGNIGQELLPLLVREPSIHEIRILTQRPERIAATVHDAARIHGTTLVTVHGEYCGTDAQTMLRTTLRGCHRLFVVLPQSLASSDMVQHGTRIIDCAREAGIAVLVRISSFGIDVQSQPPYVDPGQGPLGAAHVTLEQYGAAQGVHQVNLRPTSLFSNLDWNIDELRTHQTLSTPLGTEANVNWVSCGDVAQVAVHVLVATPWDRYGTMLDITGPADNTLTATAMAQLLSASIGHTITYREVALPTVPEYAGLWTFLRRGGYDWHCDTVERITGTPGERFAEIRLRTERKSTYESMSRVV